MTRMLNGVVVVCLALLISAATTMDAQKSVPVNSPNPGVGDTPATVPPLARGLSPDLNRSAITKAMRKVGDWELARSQQYFDQDWTFAALYTGVLAAAESLPDRHYETQMLDVGKKFDWRLGPKVGFADDQAIGQTYLALYRKYHVPAMIAPMREQFDQVVTLPDNPTKPVWWWCDALFMAPQVWAGLYGVTHERSYLDYMNREWWITSDLLYDPQEHLYFRDARFLDRREQNGKKMFWSRGNGWVMAGLARILIQLPKDHPERGRYIEQFQEMASKVASLQQSDGLWRPSLLDSDAHPVPEVSGSAFFVYALAWGINNGVLDRATYLPVVRRGWAGLISHVYEDGRLGSIQPPAIAPADYDTAGSYVYGVGAYLLAGSEILHFCDREAKSRHTVHSSFR